MHACIPASVDGREAAFFNVTGAQNGFARIIIMFRFVSKEIPFHGVPFFCGDYIHSSILTLVSLAFEQCSMPLFPPKLAARSSELLHKRKTESLICVFHTAGQAKLGVVFETKAFLLLLNLEVEVCTK